MPASAAGHERFRAEFQRRLPPDCRDLASRGLQLRATVGGAPVTWWHQPAVEVVPEQGYEALPASLT
jgi:hypothetical protein